ncbi:two-component sensor histidine kinase [Aureimonas endophytica]|uniref:histidine kinase n=1 Tax=Aureimonas endophytica TaxID=2027858 RepID=A0A916ZHI3_9HYPH|nr:ATP-binding protein [Aureimonas endophytica]GGD98261.1 two-component sensor histidine kinase [Aureimonas endophytica]
MPKPVGTDRLRLPALGRPVGRGRLVAALGVALVCAALIVAAGRIARDIVAEDLRAEAATRLPAAAAALRSELEKQRALPQILKEDPAIAAALSTRDPARVAAVNAKLARLAAATRAAVIYVIDPAGLAIAASNYREPVSFVGNDYRFRDYFNRAVAVGAAEQYALGTVSGRPGVYFSARIDNGAAAPLGVVVAKVELDAVEADWRDGGQPVFVADAHGIVLATSQPAWRFLALRPIAPLEAAGIRESLQFGTAPLRPLGLQADPDLEGFVTLDAGEGRRRFALAEAPVPGGLPGWRLHLLLPAGRDLAGSAGLARLVAALVLALFVGAGLFLLRRRRLAETRRAQKERAAAELERRVIERTADLAAANLRLTDEIVTREAAEARVASLRDDLALANRLATLGQVTAGVAHEINQPLAAIRTYAENALLFLQRGDAAKAGGNLDTVVQLTTRIAAITDTLRSFSRRGKGALEPLAVEEIVDGALLILKSRLKESGTRLERRASGGAATILGGRIRLEQVLVNLLRNAVEALEGRGDGWIRITVANEAEEVAIEVRDNGPGISPEAMAALFTPFRTTKPKGTGLGLVISSDIVTELGGTLRVASDAAGTAFTIRLPSAARKTAP